jgi:WD40 repeat protein
MLPIQEGTQQLAAFPITTRCSLSNLPQDVIHYILLHLGAESTRDCSLACKHLYVIIQDQDNGLWQKLYFRDFACYRKQNNDSFRQAYQSCHSYELNLKKGRFTCRTIAHLDYGQGKASKFCMSDGRLCIERFNGTITVQDLTTNQQLTLPYAQTYDNFNKSMVIYKNQFFLLKLDGTIGIYNLETKECLGILNNPPLEIDAFIFCDDKLILKSTDQEIWIWNIDAQAFSGSFALPPGRDIGCMAASKEKLFLGTQEGEILVLDIKTGSLLNTLAMNVWMISCLAVSENKLIASNQDGDITIWDIDIKNRLHSLTHQQGYAIKSLVVANNGKLFSASSNCSIKIWNISTGECLNTLETHASSLLCVVDKKIFSGSYSDRKIRVCDFSESHSSILANSAELLREGDHAVRIAMAQFDALPVDVKNAIYGEMYQLLKPFDNDYFGCGRHAFHNEHGLSSTRQQQAQAIENYLAKRK